MRLTRLLLNNRIWMCAVDYKAGLAFG